MPVMQTVIKIQDTRFFMTPWIWLHVKQNRAYL